MERNDADVIVVGGGLSGLAAARRLVADGVDRVVVLEARSEVGGKCLLRSANGHLLDCGAGWTGRTQGDIRNLASAYGINTYTASIFEGKAARLTDGRPDFLEPDDWGVSEKARGEIEGALAELDRLCSQVPASRPWEAPDADDLDSITLETWIRSHAADPAARLVLAHFFGSTITPPRQLSLLSLVAFVGSCGGVAGLETEADELFDGGAGLVPRRIAEELGERIRLGWPVSEISRSSDRARVAGPKGTLDGRHVIVAMSPADAGRIDFRPGLPTKREVLQKGWLPSSLIKANVVYDHPFWWTAADDRPAIGGWVTNDAGCPTVVLDASPADGHIGVLAAFTFVQGERERFGIAQEVLDDPTARGRVMLQNLGRIYGPEAERPLTVQETHWGHEPYVSGCLTFAPPGLLTHCGEALREPVGPIHWAGTETADVWINHLSGAVQAGERAATEVVCRSSC